VEAGKSQHLDGGGLPHRAPIRYKFVLTDRPFNRAWLMNVGVKCLSSGEILVLSDGDLIFNEQWAASMYETDYPAVAWGRLHLLDEGATEKYLGKGLLDRSLSVWQPSFTSACGGVNIIPRDVYFNTGGMVESFEGWGGEDNATWGKLVAFGYPFRYVDCEIWHLWHPVPKESGERRLDSYQMLSWSKEQWRRYMDEGWGDPAGTKRGDTKVAQAGDEFRRQVLEWYR